MSDSARVVATRFSSAKPAPDGACVRSPSTHQLPSGPRPSSKAQKCRKCPLAGLTPTMGRRNSGLEAIRPGGSRPVGDQAVVAVDVGDDRLEQFGALDQAGGDRLPFALVDQQRHMGQRPGALGRAGLVVDAVEDAGVAQILVGAREAARQLVGAERIERIDQRLPDRAQMRRRRRPSRRGRRRTGDSRRPAKCGRCAFLVRFRALVSISPSRPERRSQVKRQREFFRGLLRRPARRRAACGRAARSGPAGAPPPRCR